MFPIENIYIANPFMPAIGRFHVPWFFVPLPLMFISPLLIEKHTFAAREEELWFG
jgi:hypothetical protein